MRFITVSPRLVREYILARNFLGTQKALPHHNLGCVYTNPTMTESIDLPQRQSMR